MAKLMILRHDAECKACGEFLPAGTKAKWYGRGIVYGIGCHGSRTRNMEQNTLEPVRFGADEFYNETGIRLDNLND